ncbi:MAG: peptidylprolyl isomerase, partial [Oscillospiraceae bacterium]|nr:peptidylprolyl isomerase [Oscillospiraceae bacterium]
MKRQMILGILMIGMIVMSTACGASQPLPETNPQVTFEMMDGQTFTIELLPEYAPNTVNNFLSIAGSGFYEGTVFHRILPGLIIQGGGIMEDASEAGLYYQKDVGYSIKGEFSKNGFNQNTLKHERGVISTARTQDPDS